jgi:ectoine hydroxylase-related dioxygenase (phytanoyl-CoA dioxygenase family)
MDPACLANVLTEAERQTFDTRGYLVLPDALTADQTTALLSATDRVEQAVRERDGLGPYARHSIRDFIHLDDAFLELVDWPLTFPKVWGLLGWNIQVYHSHLVTTPPEPNAATGARDMAFNWHQDSGRVNWEMEGNPRPRISLKVAFFLTDTSEPDRGNFYVIPGSHKQNDIHLPNGDRRVPQPAGVPVLAPKGAAVFFDRRIWHTASANFWTEPRRVLFYGYSYRWLRPRDDMTVGRFWDRLDPIRRQLFGHCPNGGYGYTSPSDEDVPLRGWLREHLGPEGVAP